MDRVAATPRIVIAGLAGDSGKSMVSMALLRALRSAGVIVRAFKKGPDYIDPAWLSWASGHPARNLDSWLMGFDVAAASFRAHAAADGFNLIEGNRGLFDGVDVAGTHSTAELAKAVDAPVLLVLDVTKITRTAAAVVLGCQHLDPAVRIAGVVLNRVNGKRHEKICRDAITQTCGIPVVGVIPKLTSEIMPERHLGLVTLEDFTGMSRLPAALDAVAAGLDIARITSLAAEAGAFAKTPAAVSRHTPDGRGLKIAVVRDAAFSFYYPENLEALEQAGAEIIFISALETHALPLDVDAVYIGGGFPEVHAAEIEKNGSFLRSLRDAAENNLPIYAECGGLMLLSRSIQWRGKRHAMAGILPLEIEVGNAPKGHGYVEIEVDQPNPFYAVGTRLRGHEFHYSGIASKSDPALTVCTVRRGTGAYAKRDALVRNQVWASYTHLHSLATPEWANGLIRATRQHRESRVAHAGTDVAFAEILPAAFDQMVPAIGTGTLSKAPL